MHLCDQQKLVFLLVKVVQFLFSSSVLPVSVVEEDSCFVLVVEEEFPQPVNAKVQKWQVMQRLPF